MKLAGAELGKIVATNVLVKSSHDCSPAVTPPLVPIVIMRVIIGLQNQCYIDRGIYLVFISENLNYKLRPSLIPWEHLFQDKGK